ncbi:MAG: HpcH/HpaI aldolase/citrate lyase family protein, partial [Paracoccus sp. (in: a-proteobacteria)]
RDHLAAALQGGYGTRLRVVRVNGLATAWGAEDAAFVAAQAGRIDAVLVPKVGGPEDMDQVAALIPGLPLWAMVETPGGVLAAPGIAGHPRLEALVMGTNDLAKELNARFRADRLPLQAALGACVLAARAQGRMILDGVFNAFRDVDGLRAECGQGRDMGFDGKTLIHPDQLAIANEVFAPSEAEVALARRQIAAFEAAVAEGRGVAVLDGGIVENLHVETARRTLAVALAIAASGQ